MTNEEGEAVVLPQWGMGMQEGEISEWLVEVGDSVSEGDDLVEVEAEKAAGVISAPFAGEVVRLCAPEGTMVSIQAPLLFIKRARLRRD